MITTIQKIKISEDDDIKNAKKLLANNVNTLDYRIKWTVQNRRISFTDFNIKYRISRYVRVLKISIDFNGDEYYLCIKSIKNRNNKTPKKYLIENHNENKQKEVLKVDKLLVESDKETYALSSIKKLNNKDSDNHNKAEDKLLELDKQAQVEKPKYRPIFGKRKTGKRRFENSKIKEKI